MTITRRDVLRTGVAVTAASALPSFARAQSTFAPAPGNWRTFAITTKLEIADPKGKVQAWIPVPSVTQDDWIKAQGSEWTTSGKAELKRDAVYGAEFVHVEWPEGTAPIVEVTSKFAARDRALDLLKPAKVAALSDADRKLNLKATELIPTDGIVKETANKITAGTASDIDKARKIYEWIVDNTYRDPKTRGCGIGDIASLLKSGNLGGKCADLNALFVGLARASGLPARDLYGIRVAPSKFGYKSLGADSEVITKAQHCRAEVYLDGFGWVPVDPADVRKVVLEEPPGNLAIDDEKVKNARKALFGSWETNWLAYNTAHDIALPGSAGPKLAFLMYPQAERGGERLDCLDAATFKYEIKSREIVA